MSKRIKNREGRTGTMVRRSEFDENKTATSVKYDLMGDDTCTVRLVSFAFECLPTLCRTQNSNSTLSIHVYTVVLC